MLEIRDLVVTYGAICAVNGVSLTVSPGEITALVGANGAGKSSVLRAISGLARVQSGSILIDGVDLTSLPPARRAGMGLAHAMEGRRIFRQLTTDENLRLAWHFSARNSPLGVALDRVYADFPILAQKRDVKAGLLSGGQQQMVILSSAAIGVPRYLILDEPSLGLAPIIVQEIYAFFVHRCEQEGTAVLLAEQMATLALKVSNRGYIMRHGKVIHSGSSADLVADGTVAALSAAYL